MGDNDVSVKFVEVPLVSEMEMSSAMLMKDAYLPLSEEMTDDERYISPVQPAGSPHGDGSAGPNALVYVTKITNRTPPEVVEKILLKNPGRRTSTETPDFYTLVLTLSMRLGDPSTTRFLNGTIDLALPRGMKILTYSPKEKGAISAIIEQGGDALCLTAGLDISPSGAKGINAQPDPAEHRFSISVGPEEKISGTYRTRSGYTLQIPASALLEYQGMLKNEHEMFWEIYPPMPGQVIEITGNEMLAVFSLIVQAPRNTPPTITARIDGRVKGNLWGVVSLKGSTVL